MSVYAVGNVCIYSWQCLCIQLAMSVYTIGNVCIYSWQCVYIQLAVFVYAVGSVCISKTSFELQPEDDFIKKVEMSLIELSFN